MARGLVLSCRLGPRGAQDIQAYKSLQGHRPSVGEGCDFACVGGRSRGWLLATCSSYLLWALSWWRQEDNHSYYVSRLYGPSEPRSRELWVDVAKANQSQVKVHRILSNTHRQASVSMPDPGSAALGWEAGGQPSMPAQWAWL